jgi:hypothetical protein
MKQIRYLAGFICFGAVRRAPPHKNIESTNGESECVRVVGDHQSPWHETRPDGKPLCRDAGSPAAPTTLAPAGLGESVGWATGRGIMWEAGPDRAFCGSTPAGT